MKKILIAFISLALITCTLSSCMAFMPGEFTGIFGPDPCEHTFSEWTTVKEATCTNDGARKRECTLCRALESDPIVAKGHKYADGICTDCGDKR